tara:strand:- start:386 stop:568 length:183 start_codon:yes stop_codon:yes gene_type:complete
MAERPKDFDMINGQIRLAREQLYATISRAKGMMPNPPGQVSPRDVQRFTKERLSQLRGGG